MKRERRARLWERAGGHLWTVAPVALERMRPLRAPEGTRRWRALVRDERGGELPMVGALCERSARDLVVLVHGLGGSAESGYMVEAAGVAAERGWSSLRLSLRGVGPGGACDIYHAGLTRDLHGVLADPELERFERVAIIGYSLGGHMVMRAASEGRLDERVRALCAVSAPIDLSETIHHIDALKQAPYREYILSALRAHHAEMVRRGGGIAPQFRLKRVHTLRGFDALVIAPRFGFRSPQAYYEAVSASRRLHEVNRPLLYVGSRSDPMVPEASCRRALKRGSAQVEARWVSRGGHVRFPSDLDLGERDEGLGLTSQLLAWAEKKM